MTQKNSIQKLYENPKSKGFIYHLIQAYLPVDKPSKIFDFEEGQKHKCNICGQKLFSIGEYMVGVNQKFDDISSDMGDYLKRTLVNGEEAKREEHPIIKHVIGDKVIGWTGEKTNTVLCLSCIRDILELAQNGILTGDKNITWITKKIQRNEFFSRFQESPHLNDEDKQTAVIHKNMENKKVTTFGDLEALQELKRKMEEASK